MARCPVFAERFSTPWRRSLGLSIGCLSLAITLAMAHPAAAARHALLVGCTAYAGHSGVNPLYGPKNDVALFARLLKERFGFAEENITTLVSGGELSRPPTHDNIAAAFTELANRVNAEDHVVVLLSGHGVQTPIPADQSDVLDPRNPEPDGLDEVFLPEDFVGWKDNHPANALKDDAIGAWLSQMRDRGAAVWVVFDCCHSGSMSRGVHDAEIARGVEPTDIGVPREALEAAARKAAAARVDAHLPEPTQEPAVQIDGGPAMQGSLVAFYAAQAYETAPEMPRPLDAPRTPEHYHGLLSYVLAQVISQSTGEMTYRDLGDAVLTHYRAERGSRMPTPLFDGDLSRPVLAGGAARPASITVHRDSGVLILDAGHLLGLEPGAVLAYGDPVAGHLQVESVQATTAVVRPCAYDGVPQSPPDDVPAGVGCKIVASGVGEMRLALAAAPTAGSGGSPEVLREALEQLVGDNPAMLRPAEDPASADWLLRLRDADHQTIELVPGDKPNAKPVAAHKMEDDTAPLWALERDLRKAFVWNNVWRIAARVGATDSRSLRLDVRKIGQAASTPRSNILRPGDRIEVRFANEGFDDIAATFLFLDAEYGISEWFTSSVEAGAELKPFRVEITGESEGPEGIVVFAHPIAQKRLRPNLSMLLQSPLGDDDRTARAAATPRTAFDRLLQAASTGVGARSARIESAATPEVIAHSWVTRLSN